MTVWNHGQILVEQIKQQTVLATQGLVRLTHNSAALLGMVVVFAALALLAQPELRHAGEAKLSQWLQQRQFDKLGFEAEPDAAERATATSPQELPKQQAAVAHWLARKYRVAPEPLSALVAEAWSLGQQTKLEPTLILAVAAIESGFNPFAQSPVGAQGLMQVMTKIHSEKYQSFGGTLAAFDPVSNLRVGVKVLQECINRAGSVEAGLRQYVGAVINDGGDYVNKVLAEQTRLRLVAEGKNVPLAPPVAAVAAAPLPDSNPGALALAHSPDNEMPPGLSEVR